MSVSTTCVEREGLMGPGERSPARTSAAAFSRWVASIRAAMTSARDAGLQAVEVLGQLALALGERRSGPE